MKTVVQGDVEMHFIVLGFVVMAIGVAIGIITGANDPQSSAKSALVVIAVGALVIAYGLFTT
jgi:hypothetical protein